MLTVRVGVLLATVLGLFLTSTVVASADPTEAPSPSTSAASSTPDPSPSEASPSATPSAASPTPAPTSGDARASAARGSGALAERILRKYPWIDLPKSAARPPGARPPAGPGQLEAFVVPFECQRGADPVPAIASVLNTGDQTADVFYDVSGAGGVVASGALSIPPEDEVDFVIEGLTAGIYQLSLANGEGEAPVLTVEFRVLECITTSVTCGAITFTNPASNPAVQVQFGDFDEDEPDGEVTVAPGQSVTVPTPRTALDYFAFILDENSEDFGVSFAGSEEDVAIPNGACRGEGDETEIEIDSIETECATPGDDNGSAEAEVEISAGQEIRYEVTRAGRSRVVARGSAAAVDEDSEDTVEFGGLGRGSYVLRAYVGDEDDSADSKRFRVKECDPPPAEEAPEAPAVHPPLAATGGVSPLLGLGALLAVLGGAALLRAGTRRQRGR